MPIRDTSLIMNDKLARTSLLVVGFCALVWLLELGTPIFLPLVFALVVGVVFAPLVDGIERLGAPRVVCALAALAVVLIVIIVGLLVLYPVAAEFLRRLPLMWIELQEALSGLKSTMQSVENMKEQVSQTLNSGEPTEADDEGVQVPGVGDVIAYLPAISAQIMVFVGILYFFLLTRIDIYQFVERSASSVDHAALCKAEAQVSRYFLTVTAINATFGLLVTLVLMALGMPNAIYWGVGAFIANFVLYLGPIFFAFALLIAGLIVFDGPISVAPAAIFLSMNMIEGQFITPSLVGRHMSVNPLLVFMSLIFWLWLWGPLGGIIAIPILVWFRQVNKAIMLPAKGTVLFEDNPVPTKMV